MIDTMSKGGIVVKKKEMTKLRVDGAFVSATMLILVPQEIVRYKTQDKDGYSAVVVWVDKKELKNKKKWNKIKYAKTTEFYIDDDFSQTYKVGENLDIKLLENVDTITTISNAKGKWFQWAMKRFHLKGWPKTHGSKFHRQVGSLGNRKPRRVQKWHPHAGRMWGQQITLKKIKILDKVVDNNEQIIVVKGSIPGAYNDFIKLVLE